jgi:hypothetical protein
MVCVYDGVLFSHKKSNDDICRKMDRTTDHVKQNKPDKYHIFSHRQNLDLTKKQKETNINGGLFAGKQSHQYTNSTPSTVNNRYRATGEPVRGRGKRAEGSMIKVLCSTCEKVTMKTIQKFITKV